LSGHPITEQGGFKPSDRKILIKKEALESNAAFVTGPGAMGHVSDSGHGISSVDESGDWFKV
jgi:hypothetical protein